MKAHCGPAPFSFHPELPPLVPLFSPAHCVQASCFLGSLAGPLDGGEAAALDAEGMDLLSLHKGQSPPMGQLPGHRASPLGPELHPFISPESLNDRRDAGAGLGRWRSREMAGSLWRGRGCWQQLGACPSAPPPLPIPLPQLLGGCLGIPWACLPPVLSGGGCAFLEIQAGKFLGREGQGWPSPG